MSDAAIVLRETIISILISVAISIGLFLFVFGLARPVQLQALGWDCLPQSFMIGLMGSLVPPLLLRKRIGGGAGEVAIRAIAIALITVAIAGGGAVAAAHLWDAQWSAWTGLIAKALYGGVIAACVTPLALGKLLRRTGRAPA